MYTPATLHTPRGHMTRPRTYAIGTKVNPLFFKNIMNIHWTLLLPHQSALCVLRYDDRRPQAGEGHPKGVGEGPQGHKEEDGAQQELDRRSQATPCAQAPRPRAHGLLRELALEHPVRTGLYRAHGTPVRTGPTYPVRTGSSGQRL